MKSKLFQVIFLMITLSAAGQPGVEEFHQVSATIGGWYFSLSDFMLVVGAISGLLGGLRVYAAWQAGRHHIDAQIMGWLLACIFLSLVASAIKLLFGL